MSSVSQPNPSYQLQSFSSQLQEVNKGSYFTLKDGQLVTTTKEDKNLRIDEAAQEIFKAIPEGRMNGAEIASLQDNLQTFRTRIQERRDSMNLVQKFFHWVGGSKYTRALETLDKAHDALQDKKSVPQRVREASVQMADLQRKLLIGQQDLERTKQESQASSASSFASPTNASSSASSHIDITEHVSDKLKALYDQKETAVQKREEASSAKAAVADKKEAATARYKKNKELETQAAATLPLKEAELQKVEAELRKALSGKQQLKAERKELRAGGAKEKHAANPELEKLKKEKLELEVRLSNLELDYEYLKRGQIPRELGVAAKFRFDAAKKQYDALAPKEKEELIKKFKNDRPQHQERINRLNESIGKLEKQDRLARDQVDSFYQAEGKEIKERQLSHDNKIIDLKSRKASLEADISKAKRDIETEDPQSARSLKQKARSDVDKWTKAENVWQDKIETLDKEIAELDEKIKKREEKEKQQGAKAS